MDNLFFSLWRRSGGKQQRKEDFWLDPPPSGCGRLLLAVAVIGIGAWVLDHAAAVKGAADTVKTASYGLSQYGSSK
ncbi:hypothetical protein FJ420_24895 [Mesorhizobium sp. B3-1-3]|uniref:hypothetical protein n=1 Tax=unclassified Mesorhizobium TaxID=325217 RepID=UPI00112A607A|nr:MULTISPECIES: hypothetical protein [unclassified Mesorhizobium]TPI61239.1 hypothetical protein FJ424_23065 [Mesorhizobium sp. B3-1-8]TPI66348.1 hypothetical protein FJ420_24895 [Mesorhizobium sp. B3-1-3]